jgi:4,5-dihydroxyphthalate decarboxylase
MAAIFDGSVEIAGVDLTAFPVQHPMELFARMLANSEFDIAEMSLTHCYMLKQKGLARFVTVPVFPSRMFRHGFIFVNRKSVRAPQDLAGKRIGVQGYQMTAAVWIRGLLRHQYGVALDAVEWVEGGVNERGVAGGDATTFHPPGVRIVDAGSERSLSELLAAGEIDALIGALTPNSLRTSPDVVRLFPDYPEVERAYYRETGIFPIMHGLVIAKELYEANRWLATNVYKACEQSKAAALGKARFSGALQMMLPWLGAHLEEIDQLFGGDAWRYGIEPNRTALDAFSRYLVEDGLLDQPMAPEAVFVPIEGLAAKPAR